MSMWTAKPRVTALAQTCSACPSQWQGRTDEGAEIYVRYRWGHLSLSVGGDTVFSERLGHGMDGVLGTPRMKRATKHVVDWCD